MGQREWRRLRLLAGVLLAAVLLFTVWSVSLREEERGAGMHFVLIVPEQGGGQEWLPATVEELEDADRKSVV